jgi:hypothetical protein
MIRTRKAFGVYIGKKIAVGFGGIVAAVAVSLGSAPAAHADTINVVQKTRYWWDNAVYYDTGRSAMPIIASVSRSRIRSCRSCS